jgi:hypothetical protein
VVLLLIVIVCAGDSVRGGHGRRSGRREQYRNSRQQKFSNHFPSVRPVIQFSCLRCSHFDASLGFVSDL